MLIWLPLVDALRTRLLVPVPDMVEIFDRFDFVRAIGQAGHSVLITVPDAPENDL